jgi:formylglycine-generating enzyme required for sulfatase activity
VKIAKSFAVGRYAITFAEWVACLAAGGCIGYNPSDQGWGRERRPVINVSWNDAKEYFTWLKNKIDKDYRLLSEAEREYATRGGTTTPYWTGRMITKDQAQFDQKQTAKVGSFAPNQFGLYDMTGNVWEWVADCRQADGETSAYGRAPSDGSARTSGNCGVRVLRGASYGNDASALQSTRRNTNSSAPELPGPLTKADRDIGARCGGWSMCAPTSPMI